VDAGLGGESGTTNALDEHTLEGGCGVAGGTNDTSWLLLLLALLVIRRLKRIDR
jgi:MYXO-CTERM domain-containing protein